MGMIRMAKAKKDPVREERITMEIIVDAYDEVEQALGWYYYLEDHLLFPFTSICTTERSISPLQVKDEVEVLRMAPEDECAHEMFVMIRWGKKGLAVPLSQLKPISDNDDSTIEAVEDWHYWVNQGYQL
jgi:hypothetical protein